MLEDMIERLEESPQLEQWSQRTASVTGPLRPPGLRKVLSGEWLGHALHPVLTDAVVGAWMSAAILDLFGGEASEESSQLLTAIGITAAMPTALSGVSDWLDEGERVQRLGLVHALTNVLALALQCASLLVRRRGSRSLGIALGLGGLAALLAGTYLGGHLSYVLGSRVDATASR